VQNQTLEQWAKNDCGPKEGKVKGNPFYFQKTFLVEKNILEISR
jgi:hypothetical protein